MQIGHISFKVLGNCFRDVEAQNLHVALNTNFNIVSVTGQDVPLLIFIFMPQKWIVLCVKIFLWQMKSSSILMNSQQLCIPQQKLCLSTNDKERAPGEVQRGEGHNFLWCRKRGNHWEKQCAVYPGCLILYECFTQGGMTEVCACAALSLNKYFCLRNVLGWASSAQHSWSNTIPWEPLAQQRKLHSPSQEHLLRGFSFCWFTRQTWVFL